MRICEVNYCDEKHEAKGYCKFHNGRLKMGIPFTLFCEICGNIIFGKWRRNFCSLKCLRKSQYKKHRKKRLEYKKKNYVVIPQFGGDIKGRTISVFTNGFTEQIKPMIPKIRNDVLEDCIKNPRKYLD